jgi:four helix bundle protein
VDDRRLHKGADVADLLLKLGAPAIRLSEQLPATPAGRHVSLQWVKAATSACANYEEARAAESRDDFIHKVAVATKEAREDVVWMRLIQDTRLIKEPLDALIRDGEKAAAILLASKRTATKNG